MKTLTAHRHLTACLVIGSLLLPLLASAAAVTKVLPEGTRIYMRLGESVSGKRGHAQEGDMVRCAVWRDVELQGVLLVKAGAPGVCKVESVKHANIAGIKGKIVLVALETTAVDGQTVQLTGGYNKAGKSHMVLSISLGALVFLPLILITGNSAELPEGTIFDAYSGPGMPIAARDDGAARPVIHLGALVAPFTAEVILDDFQNPGAKPEVFRIRMTSRDPLPDKLVIDSVNGQPVDPMPLEILSSKVSDGTTEAIASIRIKTLAQHFQKGINRFEVAYSRNGERTSVETILNIQM